VTWWKEILDKSQFSVELRNSMGSIGTVSNISKYATELTAILEGKSAPTLIATDENVEDASVFALEKHLEDFLVANWASTELSKSYDIYEEGGELVGQQFPTDTGSIDILAISKDKNELLVIELKKGRVSDVVVGQIQRYMGFVTTELAEENQKVKGIIIGLEDDLKLKRALSVTQNIDFYKYQVSFKLFKS
jgi:restriction system protein